MTSEPDEVPLEAPEADVLEQYQPSTGPDDDEDPVDAAPDEADLADVAEQRQSVGGADDDDYR